MIRGEVNSYINMALVGNRGFSQALIPLPGSEPTPLKEISPQLWSDSS